MKNPCEQCRWARHPESYSHGIWVALIVIDVYDHCFNRRNQFNDVTTGHGYRSLTRRELRASDRHDSQATCGPAGEWFEAMTKG